MILVVTSWKGGRGEGGKSEKGFETQFLRTAVLHAHAYISKKKTTVHEKSLQILFRISQSNGKKQIHEIRIWI